MVLIDDLLHVCPQVIVCGSFKCIEHRPGSMGKSAPGFDVRVTVPYSTYVLSDALPSLSLLLMLRLLIMMAMK